MNLRIGIDFGENAIIQSGWDIHHNIRDRPINNKDVIINHNKKTTTSSCEKASL